MSNSTSLTADAVVAQYFAAFRSGDFATARRLLKDDLSFKGPIDTFNDADVLIGKIDAIKVYFDPRPFVH